ncbi:uncharacterized protein V1477_016123 [Vespula maculifrons]|uniref:CHK kinase-like domain-containing protein n=1 Tax=Vespula maculifrons TaxID=7453 RepID=A0ABD2BC46_VESMC|nr:uncharacterized protein LOC127064400 [Vespula vulgaris]XP_050851368.1 uncharacterized protein LOC127064400 [Vespula vulgaris]
MSNKVNLHDISAKLTKETLESILAAECNETDVKLTDWDFGDASAKGDSYLTVVNKVKLNGLANGKPVQIDIVIKSLPQNLGRRKTYRSIIFFRNEVAFYTKIIPKFEQFLKSKNQANILCVPRHLKSLVDGENDYLILENVCNLGYGPITRQNCVDMEQCTVILEAFATFHAISFAYKDQNKEEFDEMVTHLEETYFSPKYWDWYERFHKRLVGIATHALATEYPNSEALKRFTSYKLGSLVKMCYKICDSPNTPTSVVNQGDSWAPNVLVRDVEGDKKEALLLDFQLARCVSPILDLAFFIYSCTDKALRERFNEMLKIYHNKLTSVINSLGSNAEKLYSWETFMKEVKENFFYGIVFVLEAMPFTMLDNSQAFDLDTIIKGDEEVNIDDVWTIGNLETQWKRLRLADVIVHAVENGFL